MEALKKVKFPNYENFININEPYSNFIQKFTSVIDEIEPCKTKRVKGKFKNSRLPLDQENYKKASYEVNKLIAEKKRKYFERKLSAVKNPKSTWITK